MFFFLPGIAGEWRHGSAGSDVDGLVAPMVPGLGEHHDEACRVAVEAMQVRAFAHASRSSSAMQTKAQVLQRASGGVDTVDLVRKRKQGKVRNMCTVDRKRLE